MKILFLINSKPDTNTFRRAVYLSKYLQEFSHISVIMLYRKGRKVSEFYNFAKQILFGKYDLVHIFEPFIPTYPFLLLPLKFRRVKIIYDSGDIHYLNAKFSKLSYLVRLYNKTNEFLAYNFSNNIIVRGGSASEIISYIYGIPKDKITWISDGVNFSEFDSCDSSELRKKLGLLDFFVLGYASSLRMLRIRQIDSARGWELLEVGKMMIKSGRLKFKILIVGSGPGLNLLRKHSIDCGLREHIIFTGFVSKEEYPMYIKSMDIGFYESVNDPSYTVMMPTKLTEYMASSLPIIAGNLGEPKRTFRNNGILYRPLEPDASNLDTYISEIYTACCKLYDDRTLAYRMGINSRAIALERYDWKKVGQAYLTFLNTIFSCIK